MFELSEINWYRYGMRSDSISQFYLQTALSSCNGISHTCLSLPRQSVHALIVSFMHEISFAGFTVHRTHCAIKGNIRVNAVRMSTAGGDTHSLVH